MHKKKNPNPPPKRTNKPTSKQTKVYINKRRTCIIHCGEKHMETKLADIVNQTLNQESYDKKQELSETIFFCAAISSYISFCFKKYKMKM